MLVKELYGFLGIMMENGHSEERVLAVEEEVDGTISITTEQEKPEEVEEEEGELPEWFADFQLLLDLLS